MRMTLETGRSTQMFYRPFLPHVYVSHTQTTGDEERGGGNWKLEKNTETRQLSNWCSGELDPSDKTDTEDFCLVLLHCCGESRRCVNVWPITGGKTPDNRVAAASVQCSRSHPVESISHQTTLVYLLSSSALSLLQAQINPLG